VGVEEAAFAAATSSKFGAGTASWRIVSRNRIRRG
jgi:hypothetical protein